MPESPYLIDVSRLVWRTWSNKLPTGIDRTCLAYLQHFRRRALGVVQRGGNTIVLSTEASERIFDLLLAPGENFKRKLPALLAKELFSWRKAGLQRHIYLNVGHTGLDRPGHGEWVRRAGVRPIYFAHDIIPLTHPEYCRPGEGQKHRRRVTSLLSLGAGIITNSFDTLKELSTFAKLQNNLPMPPGLVAPLGVERKLQGRSSPECVLTRPYFVMVGTIEGRKNHLLMLNLWALMARSLGEACPQLIVIGQRGWESEQVCAMLDRNEAIRGHVIEHSRCDDATLAAYITHAKALLFPSFAEGYGLPLVEALAMGTPVIASDLSVFREIAGDIPEYLSPIDGAGWLRMIDAYAREDSSLREAQLTRLEGWSAPQWSDHFARVERWLDAINLG